MDVLILPVYVFVNTGNHYIHQFAIHKNVVGQREYEKCEQYQ